MKARTIVVVIFAALALLAEYSCTGQQNSQTAEPQTKEQAVATAAAKPTASPPTVAVSEDTVTISGSQSGTVNVPLQQGGHLIKYRYKGYGLKLETSSPLGSLSMIPGGQSPGSDGWTEFEDLTSFASSGEQLYQITATEPYEIQFLKLPLPASPDSLPKTYNGSGLQVLGPFSLKAGSATFKVACPDLKQAGFIAELYDAEAARNKGMIALGTSASVAETKKLQVTAAGDYLVKVSANGRADWTIEVSQ